MFQFGMVAIDLVLFSCKGSYCAKLSKSLLCLSSGLGIGNHVVLVATLRYLRYNEGSKNNERSTGQ